MAFEVGGVLPVNADTLEGYTADELPVSSATQIALESLGGGKFTPISGGGLLEDDWYFINDSGSYTLPSLTADAKTIVLLAANGMAPTVTSDSGELITLDVDTSDTSIEFNSQSMVILVSNVDHWDMVEVLVNGANEHTHTKDQVGLGLVDNTADVDKPISTAVQAALDEKTDGTVSGTVKVFAFAGMVM